MQFLQNLQEYNVKNLNGKLLGFIILKKTFTSVLLCLKNRIGKRVIKNMIQVFSNTCLLNVVELLLFLEDAEKGLDLGGS